MSAIAWQPGALYPTGSVVRSTSVPAPPAPSTLSNPGFESGSTGWTLTGALVAAQVPGALEGTGVLRMVGPAANSSALTAQSYATRPGQSVTFRAILNVSNARDQVGGAAVIVWLDAGGNTISASEGNQVNVRNRGWTPSDVTATAPSGTATFRVGVFCFALQAGTILVDGCVLGYSAPPSPARLVFRAVQPAVGTSAAIEPVWPTAVGQRVNDGTVVWESFEANVVVWRASPILQTGASEPVWPTEPGETVLDNGIAWTCVGRQIKDARCPQTRVVAIAAGKVYAADGDVVRYSATGNPLDWSTPDDAGFLPTGLNQNGGNNVSVLNLYRSNIVAFNASTFQMWQVDPDPEQMALLDTMEGIGSVGQRAAQPVANDLFFLTALGVRTVGIAAGSTNLQAGDIGMPVDSLVRQSVEKAAGESVDPLACYYPAAGQYWLLFPQGGVQPVLPPLTITGPVACIVPVIGASPPTAIDYTYVADGGVPPYSWSILTAPAGWTINAGRLTGNVPFGHYAWAVAVTDSAGQQRSVSVFCNNTLSLTSPPYPVEAVEEMASSVGVLSGRIFQDITTLMQPEGMDSSVGVTGATLRALLDSYTINPEAMDSTVAVQSATLRVLLISSNMLPEAMDSTVSVQSATLRAILITSIIPAEAMNSTVSVTGATLT